MDRTVKLFPQPGPPVSTATFDVNASRTACSCSGASSAPVRLRSHANARAQSTSAKAQVDGLPPGRARISSPYDPDARWAAKRDTVWNGYKVHVSETCHPPAGASPVADGTGPHGQPAGRPNRLTHVATTDTTVPDTAMTEPIHTGLAARGLTPEEHLLDSGYPSARLVVASQRDFGITLLTPLLADTSSQARAGAGYDRSAFTIDFDRQQATCPQGHTSSSWNPTAQRGTDTIVVSFAPATCTPCPTRDQCTTSTKRRRQLTVHTREAHQAQADARATQDTTDWQARYALRAGVEGTIHQATARGIRHARYRSLAKVHLQHVYTAIAINLIRLDAHWTGQPLDRTRTSHLARLEHDLAA